LAHANRLETLNELASGLAHELNQPLGIISIDASMAQFLSRDLDFAV
jgi:C4-dicarboxylate-specific signal transduction histidine kinase